MGTREQKRRPRLTVLSPLLAAFVAGGFATRDCASFGEETPPEKEAQRPSAADESWKAEFSSFVWARRWGILAKDTNDTSDTNFTWFSSVVGMSFGDLPPALPMEVADVKKMAPWLQRCKTLETLNLPGLSDEMYLAFPNLPQIQVAYLGDRPGALGDLKEGLGIIRNLPHLKTLALKKADLREKRSTLLEGLKDLNRLAIGDCKVDRATFVSIAKIPSLRLLSVFGTRIENEDVAALSALQLNEFNLANRPLDNNAIDGLSKMSTLRKLGLFRCEVSDAQLARLKAALPKTEITARER